MKLKQIDLRTEDYANIWRFCVVFEVADVIRGEGHSKIKEVISLKTRSSPCEVAQALKELAEKLERLNLIYEAGKHEGRNS